MARRRRAARPPGIVRWLSARCCVIRGPNCVAAWTRTARGGPSRSSSRDGRFGGVRRHRGAAGSRGCGCAHRAEAVVTTTSSQADAERHARRVASQRRRDLMRAGKWLPCVDAERARRRIRYLLDHGCTRRAFAAAAGNRQRHRGGPEEADLRAHVRGDPRGDAPRRRGSRGRAVPQRLGVGGGHAPACAGAGCDRPQPGRGCGGGGRDAAESSRGDGGQPGARAVADVYRERSERPAPDSVTARKTRRWAYRNGWPPPAAWDEARMDDPSGRVDQAAAGAMRGDEAA